jgi:hypothetical protein
MKSSRATKKVFSPRLPMLSGQDYRDEVRLLFSCREMIDLAACFEWIGLHHSDY